jgi:hypothetical protein
MHQSYLQQDFPKECGNSLMDLYQGYKYIVASNKPRANLVHFVDDYGNSLGLICISYHM